MFACYCFRILGKSGLFVGAKVTIDQIMAILVKIKAKITNKITTTIVAKITARISEKVAIGKSSGNSTEEWPKLSLFVTIIS